MSQIFLGQLSPGEVTVRQSECQKQKDYGGGVTLGERLGFVMQFKPGDTVMLIDAYNTASAVQAEVEGAMDWGAYQVRILQGPRAGESIVVNWAAVTPVGPGFTEMKGPAPKKSDYQLMGELLRANRSVPTAKLTEDTKAPLRMKRSQVEAQNVERKQAGLPEFKLNGGK